MNSDCRSEVPLVKGCLTRTWCIAKMIHGVRQSSAKNFFFRIIYRSSLPSVVITCLFSILLVGIARFDRCQQTLSQISSPWSPYTRLADWQRQQRCQARLCGALRRWRCHVLWRKGERVEQRKCQVRGWNGGDGSGHMKVEMFWVFTYWN